MKSYSSNFQLQVRYLSSEVKKSPFVKIESSTEVSAYVGLCCLL